MMRRGGSPARQTMRDIKDEVKRLSDLGQTEQSIERSFSGQVSAMRRDLQLVNRQVDFERERRAEIERQIAIERSENVPPEHAQAILRREEDIKAIRDEKNGMLEWLQRGVSEAKRLSVELEKQRTTTQTSLATKQELETDRQRLKDLETRLSEEVQQTREKIQQINTQKATLQDHTEQQSSLLSVTGDITDGAIVDKSRLQEDVDKLQQRARDIETCEMAISCMAAAVRRSLHTLETMNDRIAKGAVLNDYDDKVDDEDYDSDADADGTRVSSVVLSSTKAKIGRCQALLLTLQSSLKRFDTDQVGRALHERKSHDSNLELTRAECERIINDSNAEVEHLRSIVNTREPQLRNAIQLRDKAIKESPNFFEVVGAGSSGGGGGGPMLGMGGGGFDAHPPHYPNDDAPPPGWMEAEMHDPSGGDRFGLLKYYDDENASMMARMTELSMENQRLEGKVKSLDADYTAVKELKKQYRELEAGKMLCSQTLREQEQLNRELKFILNEKALESAPASKPKRPPWRAVPL